MDIRKIKQLVEIVQGSNIVEIKIREADESVRINRHSTTTSEQLECLHKVCEKMSASSHKKTRELGREFLNDWEAIFRELEFPAWPLTNNEAEQALRH